MRKKERQRLGRLSRAKGHDFEREIASRLRVVFPNARRQLEYHQRDARGVDLQETGEFRFQLKRGRQYAPLSKIEEIQCDRLFGEIPVLVTRADEREALACLPFEDLLRLLTLAYKERSSEN